ncbi:hypothetical protein DL96DRAFT_1784557 [Flagelloscypha sp. PMI_526]|nr:hypothetical protein DL96DRAFT_1784557 [Flagelloscypha sp. PMI_526]
MEALPPELVALILEELPLQTLIVVSYLSRHLYTISADSSLNPWRQPILHILRTLPVDEEVWAPLKHLSVRRVPPRSNFIDILSLAPPFFILFELTLPNLSSEEWKEAFRRRFLPSWATWIGTGWRQNFLKSLHRVFHRSQTSCTFDETWTKFIVLNKDGSVNQLEMTTRNFNPLAIFNEMKLQNNLMHLETRIRLVIELADVRILVFGTLNRPRTNLTINHNAHTLLHPPGIDVNPRLRRDSLESESSDTPEFLSASVDHGVYSGQALDLSLGSERFPTYSTDYRHLTHPLPATMHKNYPFHTAGGLDARWNNPEDIEEPGLRWVGNMLIAAQLIMPNSIDATHGPELVAGNGRSQWCSFSWADLWTIAPWLRERVPESKCIDGEL